MADSNWQIGLSTIRERAKYAFNNSLFCDVEFLVADSNGDKVTMSANKFILAVTSPVFGAMFYGQLSESKSPIELPDCTKEGFQELLRFAYSEEVNLSCVNLMEVMYLADKYMIPSLADKCRGYFKKKVRPQNVFLLLPEVSKLNNKAYEELCWDVIDRETKQAVLSPSFLDISHELLCQVLSRDSLRVKEVVLFEAVDGFASKRIRENELESNCETKRAVLGEKAIKLIRFLLMSQKEFAEAVLPTEILKMSEVTEIIQTFSKLPVLTMNFSRRKRQAKDRLIIPANRFDTNLEETVKNKGYQTALFFTVNKPVNLNGFRMFGSVGCTYNVNVSVLSHNGGPKVNRKNEMHRENMMMEVEEGKIDDHFHGFTASFSQPITLFPDQCYVIFISVQDPGKQPTLLTFGCNARPVVYCEDLEVSFENALCKTTLLSQESYTSIPKIEGGQIQSFIFTKIN